ncbi:MAG: STAS domain-containing protein [Magnetococcales bacterium]|nr:STAS domain-containing protein [Magnetococcales bacterium]NGZ26339.1 STAS domain-containing protein [Magnetococcales bacterium]
MEILLPAESTLETIAEIQNLLLQGLQRKEEVTISFRQVERADLSLFQLLLVAEKSYKSAGARFNLLPDLPASLAFKASVTQWSCLIPGGTTGKQTAPQGS